MQASPGLLEQLRQISVPTVRRILQRLEHPSDSLPKAHSGRLSDSAAQTLVPLTVIPWQEPEPGPFEVALVHHSRTGCEGSFICTVQFIDVLTGWSEPFAVMGYSFDSMWRIMQRFAHTCPLPIREVLGDNGPEFINMALVSYFGEQMGQTSLTRDRMGYKNDNRFVEQKNGSLVHAYLQHLGLHTPEQLAYSKLLPARPAANGAGGAY